MKKIDLTQYGITGTTEVVYNPSYDVLFEEETKPELTGRSQRYDGRLHGSLAQGQVYR